MGSPLLANVREDLDEFRWPANRRSARAHPTTSRPIAPAIQWSPPISDFGATSERILFHSQRPASI